jgi:hypothetical protein
MAHTSNFLDKFLQLFDSSFVFLYSWVNLAWIWEQPLFQEAGSAAASAAGHLGEGAANSEKRLQLQVYKSVVEMEIASIPTSLHMGLHLQVNIITANLEEGLLLHVTSIPVNLPTIPPKLKENCKYRCYVVLACTVEP